MFDRMHKQIDAVLVATPDHSHYPPSMIAMGLGKHVYCEKPLGHSILECRKMAEAARKSKVVTQMGNQGQSGESLFMIREWYESGALGEVREVNCWNRHSYDYATHAPRPAPVPDHLDWDVWLGPAPHRPHAPGYAPAGWHKWRDFGNGINTGYYSHTMSAIHWALQLGAPDYVEAESLPVLVEGSFPPGSIVTWHFPAREDRPAVEVRNYTIKMVDRIPRPHHLEPGRELSKLQASGGLVLVGSEASLVASPHAYGARIIPEATMREVGKPPKKYERPSGGHMASWLSACKGGGGRITSPFEYGAITSEICMLGTIASLIPGKRLRWDAEKMEITNHEGTDAMVRGPVPRKGFDF
jgi:hypothetical protein